MRLLPITATILLTLPSCGVLDPVRQPPPPDVVPALEHAQGDERIRLWLGDVDEFESMLHWRHAGLYAVVPEKQFNESIAQLRRDLPNLRDDEIVVRMKMIATSIGSAHTGIWASRGHLVSSRLPIECRWLSDGVLVTAASDEYPELRGAHVLGVGNNSLAVVLEALAKITPHENDAYLRRGAPQLLVEADTLHGLGLIDDPNAVPFKIRRRDGHEMTVTLAPRPGGESFTISSAADPTRLSFTRLPRADDRIYGSRLLEDDEALYVWYDACREAPNQTVAEFAAETLATIDASKPRLVIIDLRRNGGGNSGLLAPLIDGIAARPIGDNPRKLAILIGPATFSSAGLNVEEFEERTKATLVGEPTGQRPHSWMECRWDWLPNSLMQVNYMMWPPSFAPDIPDSYMPDILVPVTCEDWLSGRDVVFERALQLAH